MRPNWLHSRPQGNWCRMLMKSLDHMILQRARKGDKMRPWERRLSLAIDRVTILLEEGDFVQRAFAGPMLRTLERFVPRRCR